MLSYQHAYHAGNLADVHKHAALAWALTYLTQKDKPLSYIETHAGRGMYDLTTDEAVKTGEAQTGIGAVGSRFVDTAFGRCVAAARAENGPSAYPGSPWIAAHILRDGDDLHLAELHPQERAALTQIPLKARVHAQDGFALAHSLCPPTPRRGLMLIDPSYEVKDEYAALPHHVARIQRAWPVGVIMIWYPILVDPRHGPMVAKLRQLAPQGLSHEVRFAPARPGHGMTGSGLFVVNPPWGMDPALGDIAIRMNSA